MIERVIKKLTENKAVVDNVGYYGSPGYNSDIDLFDTGATWMLTITDTTLDEVTQALIKLGCAAIAVPLSREDSGSWDAGVNLRKITKVTHPAIFVTDPNTKYEVTLDGQKASNREHASFSIVGEASYVNLSLAMATVELNLDLILEER